jgi:hypothetical protein
MLKEYFDENGMKQSEIAKELDVTQSAVCNQLSGRPFGRSTANIWNEKFGFDIGWLMTGDGEMFYSKYPKYVLPADKNRFVANENISSLIPVIPAWMFRAPNIIIDECINNKTYKKQMEYMPMIHQFRPHDVFARCPGDAMSPKICKGNVVALKRLDINNIKYSLTTIFFVTRLFDSNTQQGVSSFAIIILSVYNSFKGLFKLLFMNFFTPAITFIKLPLLYYHRP